MIAQRAALLLAAWSIGRAAAQLPVSAKAGLLYFYDGEALVDGKRLLGGGALDRLAAGQLLEVRSGKIEMLLQPGNYVRAATGTSIRMLDDSLSSTHLHLAGSAIVEITRAPSRTAVVVRCGESDAVSLKPGIYRFECTPGQPTAIKVFEGKFDSAKAGQRVTLPVIGKPTTFDRKDLDDLDRWSAQRSEMASRFREGSTVSPPGQGTTYRDPRILRSQEPIPPP